MHNRNVSCTSNGSVSLIQTNTTLCTALTLPTSLKFEQLRWNLIFIQSITNIKNKNVFLDAIKKNSTLYWLLTEKYLIIITK